MELNKSLVSIVVVTYNSVETIIETLESIKAQTYKNIELIISDDSSQDDTVQTVLSWMAQNKNSFIKTDVVTSIQNTGVAANINRGVSRSNGEWIKAIAGDDLLVPTAIDEFLNFVYNQNEKVRMCVCDVEPFSANSYVNKSILKSYSQYFKYVHEPFEKQLFRVCREMIFPGPGFFYTKALFDEIGGCSEEYSFSDEWPLVYKVLKGGNRIYALDKKLVMYRVSETSLSRSRKDNGLENSKYFYSGYFFFFDYPFKDLLQQHRYMEAWHMYLIYNARRYQYISHNSILSRVLLRLVSFISPYAYLKKIGKVN